MTQEEVIKQLNLKPHPKEGGFYRETYRSNDLVANSALNSKYTKDKAVSTAIYFFLTPETCSRMHKINSDEIFHFYLGDSVTMLQLFPDGKSKVLTLGNDIVHGQSPQVVVNENIWQGSFLSEGGSFALLGTTVAPGFDFEDYIDGNREELIKIYPQEKELIERLT